MILIARIVVEVSKAIPGSRGCAEIDDRVPVSIRKPVVRSQKPEARTNEVTWKVAYLTQLLR
jgi:hypothetical protein